MKTLRMTALSVASLFVAIATMAPTCETPASGAPVDGDLEVMKRQIDELIGSAEADEISQCKSAAFGAKPCGGPRGFLVYSTKGTDETELLSLLDDYYEADKANNLKLGLASDCSLEIEPDVELADGICVAG